MKCAEKPLRKGNGGKEMARSETGKDWKMISDVDRQERILKRSRRFWASKK